MGEIYHKCDSNTKLGNPKKFDCGIKELNRHLQNNFLTNIKNGSRKGEIFTDSVTGNVIGFMVTSPSALLTQGTLLQAKKLPHEVPCLKIWMIGVDQNYQGKGLGKNFILNAIIDAVNINNVSKCLYVYLDAAPTAISFYETLGFEKLMADESKDGKAVKMILDIEKNVKEKTS